MFTSVARIALVAALPLFAMAQAVFAQDTNGGFRLDLGSEPDESKQEARDSEALLLPEDRMALQTALQWFGFYAGAIDGDFGPGSRKSMSAWQEYQGVDPTGVLTTRQRVALFGAYYGEIESYGFASVTDDKAGITVMLPTSLVEFDRYEPPFAHYKPKTPDAPQIVLISQPGDQAALYGLYDILQSLKSVPMDGERERGEKGFQITGLSSDTATTVQVQLDGGLIKGWMLISTPGNADRDARILQLLQSSFTSSSEAALDPGMVPMTSEAKAGMIAGLEVRTPRLSRSGFFISAEGAVLTTVEAVEGCTRVTIDHATDATVTLKDATSGLALLTPNAALAPRSFATFPSSAGRPGSEVTLAGYSYEDRLPAPVLTFGTLEELTGLAGEADLRRLALPALPGDVGGPVLDGTGALIGMLLPAAAPAGKQLPPGVTFALGAAAIAKLIEPAGIIPTPATATETLLPSDMTDMATGMTALVSCWD